MHKRILTYNISDVRDHEQVAFVDSAEEVYREVPGRDRVGYVNPGVAHEGVVDGVSKPAGELRVGVDDGAAAFLAEDGIGVVRGIFVDCEDHCDYCQKNRYVNEIN